MRNIKIYNGKPFDFYKDNVKKKCELSADINYESKMNLLETKIEELYNEFDVRFGENRLEVMSSYGYTGATKSDLINLYSYNKKTFQDLKKRLTTTEQGRSINTCQNCTINEVNSFDHYLPKTEFPEYAVNPKNLIPSCTKCNSHKSVVWHIGLKRLFLNLYIDILPDIKYLFVDIYVESGVVLAKFYLDNDKGFDDDLFNLISNHYKRLKLLERFSENSNEIITNLEHTIMSSISVLSISEIVDIVNGKNERDKIVFGCNFWKVVLENALINSDIFMERFSF